MRKRSLILEEIEEAIRREPRISGEVDVEVDDRNVTISGVVTSLEEKELAGGIAKSFGPIRLENDIVIESAKIKGDTEILNSARQAIESVPELTHNIGVDRVVNGIVYLRGKSESIGDVRTIAEAVATAPGVCDLVSEVEIETVEPHEDIDIVNEIMQAFHTKPSIHEEFIEAQVKDGVVYLSGNVEKLKQKTLATAIAQRSPGVIRVINNLETSSSPGSLDKALENETIKAIESNEIDMRDMNVSVLDGVTFLDGTVGSIRQRDRAGNIAEEIVGIRLVQNNLVVGFR
jgi:osmotically-inducible protein OsmY